MPPCHAWRRCSFLTTTSVIATRGVPQPVRVLLPGDRPLRMPYRVRNPEGVGRQIEADGHWYAVFLDNNLGGRRDYLRRLCRALRPLDTMWSAAVSLDVTDEPSLVREMALARHARRRTPPAPPPRWPLRAAGIEQGVANREAAHHETYRRVRARLPT